MVFYYTIRGGACQNSHSQLTLTNEDIICYMGRDKHENEYLIRYGWPGDVWFHVEGLSSAHVYFRITNLEKLALLSDGNDTHSFPLSDLPEDSVYDMMQLVKHNSIQGCKLASCKIVYTPHSNLKKTFQMDAGTVTYHNTKLCVYKRCDKDRTRIKQLEKTKVEENNVDFYAQLKFNERLWTERNKRLRKQQHSSDIFDPVLEDLKSNKLKAGRQGDASSGIDQGVAALESLRLSGDVIPHTEHHPVTSTGGGDETISSSSEPCWIRETNQRQSEPNSIIKFMHERGYSTIDGSTIDPSSSTQINLQTHWKMLKAGDEALLTTHMSDEEITQARIEERQVLQAIFADEVKFPSPPNNQEEEECPLLNATFPITSYEPPDRYGLPPPLVLEVYVDGKEYCRYPETPPVLALRGGGLPESLLHKLTIQLRTEALQKCVDEPSDPQLFNLVTFVGEQVEIVIEEETMELAQIAQKLKQERMVKQRATAAKLQENGDDATPTQFRSEHDRRAYAQQVLEKGAKITSTTTKSSSTSGSKKYYNSGISDQSLIDDLFC